MNKPFLVRHLSGESAGRFPVWLMRQAGRYLPNYQAIRREHSFWEMVTTPSLAAQVSLLPLEVLPVDAVIFFSDILTLPYGLGIPIEMKEAIGPVVTRPLRCQSDFSIFDDFNPQAHTTFVGEALRSVRAQMPSDCTLIGFAGAPWTVGCYLVQGRGKTEFEKIKTWSNQEPTDLASALDRLAKATVSYLLSQVEAGANVIQLFDTWLGEMPDAFFTQHYLPLLNRIFEPIRKQGVKVIYFAKGADRFFEAFQDLEVDALGVEPGLDLLTVERRTGRRFSLQGNLSPEVLLGDIGEVRRQTRQLVATARSLARPAIINLGHGVLPKTPVENVQAFVNEARTLWL